MWQLMQFQSKFSVSKFLITTGSNSAFEFVKESELLDLTTKGGNLCKNNPVNFPEGVINAYGGLVGDTVLICGGYDGDIFMDACYTLSRKSKNYVTQMSVIREHGASLIINDTTLWITGGRTLASSEFITVTGTEPGPDLPMALWRHAIVAISNKVSMIIGGDLNHPLTNAIEASDRTPTGSTFYGYHTANGTDWINGPSLIHPRIMHMAGIVTDTITNENFVVVTGGNFDIPYQYATEILQNNEWLQGRM